jgi:beta-galactosidase
VQNPSKFILAVLIAYLVTLLSAGLAAETTKTIFTHPFAPSEVYVKPMEQPYRDSLCLNGRWQFQPVAVPPGYQRESGTPPDLSTPAPNGWDTTPIKIPSPWNVNTWGNGRDVGAGTDRPYQPGSVYYPSYPASWDHAEMGWMRRSFRVPTRWSGKRLVLHFEAVAGECVVLVNNHTAARHFDSFLPFECDVTDLVNRSGDNELRVGVRAANLFNKRSLRYGKFLKPYPDGSSLDGITGIWQDVYLLALPAVHIADAFVEPVVDQDTLKVQVTIRNDSPAAQRIALAGNVQPWVSLAGRDILSAPEPRGKMGASVLTVLTAFMEIPAHSTGTVTLHTQVKGALQFWTPQTPHLYGLVLSATGQNGVADRQYTRFGWRQLKIKGRDLLLNGRKIQLFGDLCHPFGPFMMSRRFAWAWFRLIQDWGGNAVRLHAQPYPRYFLDMADEMGILVLDEDALFGSSVALNLEEPVAWDRFHQHFEDLVRRDRSHPSVFGWSFGNEMFALLDGLSPEDTRRYRTKLAALGQSAFALDPTRPWISCDGDGDLEGMLPTWSHHFGHGLPLNDLPKAAFAKPLMVGESGGSYYARPSQMAEFNGERAYQSYADRNDALGIDVYQNVVQMARPFLTFFSASETVWFGIEHLNLGYRDFTRLPNLDDGIFFGPYTEGQPGMQPERIPPYAATLNPGWDPKLPLYKPLGMFHAMKAALHRPAPLPSLWDHLQKTLPHPAPPIPMQDGTAFAGDKSGELYRHLYALGVPFAESIDGTTKGTLLVDGQGLTSAALPGIRTEAEAVTAHGGTVIIFVKDKAAPIDLINHLLPIPAQLTNASATMLDHKVGSPWVDSFTLPDLYFAEDAVDQHILKCGISGPFADNGAVLLTASNTDWSLFNDVGEIAKCGAVELYERLKKPSGDALIAMPEGPGRVVLSAIDYTPDSEAYVKFWRQLLSNTGLRMQPVRQKWLLPTAAVSDTGVLWHYATTPRPAGDWTQPGFDDSRWKTGHAGFGDDVPGGKWRTAWTDTPGDIWLRTDLEATAPDIDSLKIAIYHDEDVEVFVNGTQIFQESGFITQYKVVALSEQAQRVFHTGGNTIAVHCHQVAGGQYIDVGFLSGAAFRSSTTTPGQDLLLNGPQSH